MPYFEALINDSSRGGTLAADMTLNEFPDTYASSAADLISSRYAQHMAELSWAEIKQEGTVTTLDMSDTIVLVSQSFVDVFNAARTILAGADNNGHDRT